MQHQIELAYLGLEVPEPAGLSSLFEDVAGLVPGERTDGGALTWRNDGKVHRIFALPGPANDAAFLGFEATDSAAFDATVARLESFGCRLVQGTAQDLEARRVDRLVRTAAPWGVDVELVSGLAGAAAPFRSPPVPGGFLTEGVGFGHVVFATPAFEESHSFLIEGLGFGQSDWLETEIAEGIELEVHFYHCNARHHSVALARVPFELPQALHHVMFETNRRDDVGTSFDRAWATDLPIPNGLGRHDNDGMFSFYVAGPAGFQVEVGYGARVVGEDWQDDRRYDRISAWGHQLLRSGR